MSELATKPLHIDGELYAEAEALGIDVAQTTAAGIRQAIRKEKERLWLEENAEAIKSSNEWVEKNGLPLEKYRVW